ncbi:MAG: cytochrome c [Candidatus Karelsulcia muelleri]|nr:MAG: cytochrome c [Candidatus Karelsulcia muelleri]
MSKKYIYIFIYIIMMVSCNQKIFPKNVYMPDMYYSKAYEPYIKNIFPFKNKIKTKMKFSPFGKSFLNPVKGTIPQNKEKILPYTLPNNNKGYNLSKEIKISPLKGKKKSILKRGKYLYDINCAICHGYKGDGNGILVKNEKIFGVPSYKELDICIGSIFHVIMYGKKNMGSYYSNLSMLDRCKIAEYVMNLKYKN